MSEKIKRRWGDRKDGRLIRDLDALHYIMPLIYPNRCDNEAYISERIDLTAIQAYVDQKNAVETEFKYTYFHIVVAALLKTITLRPKMNRFIANKTMYQRNEVSAAFVVKKLFADDGSEALAVIHAQDEDTLETLHEKLYRQISSCRSDKLDQSSNAMDIVSKLPRFVSHFIAWLVTKLEKHGKCPQALIATDPFYSSVVVSNLGSLKLKCGYHHLTNWGTTSIFCIIGEKRQVQELDENGQPVLKQTLDLGLTIDERLADGYYYSKTIRLFKHLAAHPELLELPLAEPVEY